MVICNVAKILELVVPLMEHPSETFMATIEEDLMKLIIKYGMLVGENYELGRRQQSCAVFLSRCFERYVVVPCVGVV